MCHFRFQRPWKRKYDLENQNFENVFDISQCHLAEYNDYTICPWKPFNLNISKTKWDNPMRFSILFFSLKKLKRLTSSFGSHQVAAGSLIPKGHILYSVIPILKLKYLINEWSDFDAVFSSGISVNRLPMILFSLYRAGSWMFVGPP